MVEGGGGGGGGGGRGLNQSVLDFHSGFRFQIPRYSLCSQTPAQFIRRLIFAIETTRSSLPPKFFAGQLI